MRKRLLMLAGLFILLAQTVFAQTVEVSGRITDNKGEPIAGVSVTEKGTRSGTTTNAGGNFKLLTKEKAVLVFTSIGFGWSGLGYVGWKGSWIQVSGAFRPATAAHELGHNVGLWHAGFWNAADGIGTGFFPMRDMSSLPLPLP